MKDLDVPSVAPDEAPRESSRAEQASRHVAPPKHTPGPWEVVDMTSKGEGYKVQAPEAHYSRSNIAHFMTQADACLVAASPNLLDALETVLDGLGALSNPTELHGLLGISEAEAVFDALKKAKGRA